MGGGRGRRCKVGQGAGGLIRGKHEVEQARREQKGQPVGPEETLVTVGGNEYAPQGRPHGKAEVSRQSLQSVGLCQVLTIGIDGNGRPVRRTEGIGRHGGQEDEYTEGKESVDLSDQNVQNTRPDQATEHQVPGAVAVVE